MVAAHLLKIPFLKAYDQVVILRIPVVKRGDMKAAVKTVELIVFVSDFFVSRVRKQDDALMAAAVMETKPTSLTLQYRDISP